MLTCNDRAAILADANSSGHLGAGQAAAAIAPVEVPHLGRGAPSTPAGHQQQQPGLRWSSITEKQVKPEKGESQPQVL